MSVNELRYLTSEDKKLFAELDKRLETEDYADCNVFDSYRADGKIKLGKDGFFYVVRPFPQIAPERVKLGYSSDPYQRIGSYRTICPEAQLVSVWPCNRDEESIIMKLVTIHCRKAGPEVFDVDSLDALHARIGIVVKRKIPSKVIAKRKKEQEVIQVLPFHPSRVLCSVDSSEFIDPQIGGSCQMI